MQPGSIDFLYCSHFWPQRWQQQTILFVQQAHRSVFISYLWHIRLPDEQEGKIEKHNWVVFKYRLWKVWNSDIWKMLSPKVEKDWNGLFITKMELNVNLKFLEQNMYIHESFIVNVRKRKSFVNDNYRCWEKHYICEKQYLVYYLYMNI